MIVCSCKNTNDEVLLTAIKEAPILPSDPYALDYQSDEDQIYQYVQDQLGISTGCKNCEILIREIIRSVVTTRNNDWL